MARSGEKRRRSASRTVSPSSQSPAGGALRDSLRSLYFGNSRAARLFRYGLLVFDVITVAFIVSTSFLPRTSWVEWLDLIFGVIILADFSGRLYASRHPAKEFTYLATWADIVAIISFLAPVVGEGLAFVRIFRTLRLLRTYQIVARLRVDSPYFRRHEETVVAILNLVVFLFVMTGVVYQTQHWRNPAITNYIDALYFTVTALTTTGFGDITLPGTLGRIITIVIMISGVTLFLRLLQAFMRPHKVRHPCPTCGLQRHDVDAVHCKACGMLLNIPDEGLV